MEKFIKEDKFDGLPKGGITTKRIKSKSGKFYDYKFFQWTENGKQHSKRVSDEEAQQIEQILSVRKRYFNDSFILNEPSINDYQTDVKFSRELLSWAESVKNWKFRDCYNDLKDYLSNDEYNKVFILYGLRRTGKTTLIKQAILSLNEIEFEKSTYIQIKKNDNLQKINKDLRLLEAQGYKYIFIDEVTLMEDFIEGAALFSDIFVPSGMKIILSGTDSLGFWISKSNSLYDRCILLHTTFIPYKEFEEVLNIKGIDEYIKYGGTMSMGGTHYNVNSLFATAKDIDEYIDTAIAQNIQHSLKYYQDGGHFRALLELYDKDELTNGINRVVDDLNHRFTKQVLIKTFKSNVLSLSARNLLHDRNNPFDLMENINEDFVLDSIKKILDILEQDEQSVDIDNVHTYQIKEYLLALDLINEIDLLYLPDISRKEKKIVISQPGLRYAQTEALINSLMLDKKFEQLSIKERTYVINRIMDTIKGRMMEDIVLLETKIAKPKMNVFQLQFDVGEFDMVVQNLESLTCEIYEIKHSNEIVKEQYHYLIDQNKCEITEHRFGEITSRFVVYRGPSQNIDNIQYLNVEEYLKSLRNK